MKQLKKRDRRAARNGAPTDSKSIRAAFIINMFREFPDREFSLKQLTSASGGNSKEARYIVRDVVEALTMLVNFVTEYLFQRFLVFGNSLDTAKKEEK